MLLTSGFSGLCTSLNTFCHVCSWWSLLWLMLLYLEIHPDKKKKLKNLSGERVSLGGSGAQVKVVTRLSWLDISLVNRNRNIFYSHNTDRSAFKLTGILLCLLSKTAVYIGLYTNDECFVSDDDESVCFAKDRKGSFFNSGTGGAISVDTDESSRSVNTSIIVLVSTPALQEYSLIAFLLYNSEKGIRNLFRDT